MQDKQLLEQLKNLRSLKLSDDWKTANRLVLRNQLYSGERTAQNLNFWAKLNLSFSRLSEPYAVAAAIFLFFVLSASGSLWMAQSSKPGEILYNAKLISERTKYALTFGDHNKTKLNLQFAKQRVEELASLNENKPDQETPKLEALKTDFKKELVAARQKLSKIKPTVNEAPTVATVEPTAATGTAAKEDLQTAASLKNEQRIDISVPAAATAPIDPVKVLDEAELLFDKQDYGAAKDALDQANDLLEEAAK